MRHSIAVAIALLWPWTALAQAPADADVWSQRFEPLSFLAGHCWSAEFPRGQRDVQCFRWIHDRRMIFNTHVVLGTDPRYGGSTIYSWDPDAQRLRFHYFTTIGAVSEGHLVPQKAGYLIPERHVGAAGRVTELESRFRREGDEAFTVLTRQLGDGEWTDIGTRRYARFAACPEQGECDAAHMAANAGLTAETSR